MPLWAVLECTVRSLLQNNIGEVLLNTFGANTFGAVLQYTFEAILLQVLQCGHVVSQYYLLHIWAPLDCVNCLHVNILYYCNYEHTWLTNFVLIFFRCTTKSECSNIKEGYWLPSVKNKCLSLEFKDHPLGFGYKLDADISSVNFYCIWESIKLTW